MKKITSGIFVFLLTVLLLCVPFSAYAENVFQTTIDSFSYNGVYIPKYDGELSETLNGNEPYFTQSELNQNIYESYGALDSKGRVTVCSANIDQSLMPEKDEERGDISSIYPTGWVQNKYDFVSGKYLYNRSHLIGWQLTAENANRNNLMTGTRSFNAIGMLQYENEVASYVKENANNNVLYRVTPVFTGDDLLAKGVIMEAESVDDNGDSVKYCVFVYNVENGVSIDYATGNNVETGKTVDLSGAYICLSSLNIQYTGKAITPLQYVKLNNNQLKKGTDYTVQYKNNIKAGTATVTVYGKDTYSGACSKTFKIYNPKPKTPALSKVSANKKGFKAVWKKVSGISGYQVQYSLKKNFKSAKTVTVANTKATSKSVKKLKAKKKYYVRIRTYKTVAGKKFYSAWSKSKTVKTK